MCAHGGIGVSGVCPLPHPAAPLEQSTLVHSAHCSPDHWGAKACSLLPLAPINPARVSQKPDPTASLSRLNQGSAPHQDVPSPLPQHSPCGARGGRMSSSRHGIREGAPPSVLEGKLQAQQLWGARRGRERHKCTHAHMPKSCRDKHRRGSSPCDLALPFADTHLPAGEGKDRGTGRHRHAWGRLSGHLLQPAVQPLHMKREAPEGPGEKGMRSSKHGG